MPGMRYALLPAGPRQPQSTYVVAFLVAAIVSHGATRADDRRVDFGRDIAPILSDKCFQCHGPDVEQRQAELRLDTPRGALMALADGGFAIVPGQPDESRLLQRITSTDDDQMPPPDAQRQLSQREKRLLEDWIRQGAPWNEHWAFRDLTSQQLPTVNRSSWIRTPVDAFILRRHEQNGVDPAPTASRRVLARRLYFDLVGIPPTPAQLVAFEQDAAPDAYSRLVDRLLASPRYGERWGRHWLDIARYGDSNGGDENHLYPNAHRYRNYVIDAWNRGVPYDRFLLQQLAGDLLGTGQDERAMDVTATGFLAIGMKILAEQDPVKKRSDIVDEQIDTFGKAVLGMTLGCARCHDHKFDPVPTTDYYALAGIFHSTDVIDAPLETAEFLAAKSQFEVQLAELETRRATLEKRLTGDAASDTIVARQAESFERGNVSVVTEGYGEGIGIISDPGAQQNYVEYDFSELSAGKYLLQLRYAAEQARPGRIHINGELIKDDALAQATGGWYPQHQRWFREAVVVLQDGLNTIRIESEPLMSHLDQIRLIAIGPGEQFEASLSELEDFDKELERVRAQEPKAQMAMAVRDGEVRDARVHIRGSHLQLGDEVPRRFLSALDSSTPVIPTEQSGRRELAEWLTRSGTPAAALTGRVIANRVWLWHFGQGLVETPNDFGLQGARPTHPQLLDWLAASLIRNDWSIKELHRQIVLSNTYRMSGQLKSRQTSHEQRQRLYAYRPAKRLEAEVFRDTVLWHAGALEERVGGAPPNVKSGDPSPEDLARNRASYQDSRRRSVYLPIVRSNIFEMLTLLDFPNSASPTGKRSQTIVPTQSLLLLNNAFVMTQAERIASRLQTEVAQENRVAELYLRLFGRSPTMAEIESAQQFLESFQQTGENLQVSWTALCQTLLISHEFFYVE